MRRSEVTNASIYMAPSGAPTRADVDAILSNPFAHGREWTWQGLGMIRTAIGSDGTFRLNVWNQAFKVPKVSAIHTHPWDLVSIIQCGSLTNQRYTLNPMDLLASHLCGFGTSRHHEDVEDIVLPPFHVYDCGVVGCGEGGGLSRDTIRYDVKLWPFPLERYDGCGSYRQDANEIHETSFDDGTVSLNLRTNRASGNMATVFWPRGKPWVDAAPRAATRDEVYAGCERALRVLRGPEASPGLANTSGASGTPGKKPIMQYGVTHRPGLYDHLNLEG